MLSFIPAGGSHAQEGSFWNAPDRAAKVAALIPGRRIPQLTPETLFADWTAQKVEQWNATHPAETDQQCYDRCAAAAPTDQELTAGFPVHISPFGRLHSGKSPYAENVLLSFCPFCQSQSLGLTYDPNDPCGHATTTCCRTDLYADEDDYPVGSPLRPNSSSKFLHLDDTWVEVPSTLYTDQNGVVWELFIKTLFDHQRWVKQGCDLVAQYGNLFKQTGDPLYAHKIAVILDRVADTYYGLPLSAGNDLAEGLDGKPLTRAGWEALPRPMIFEVGPLGGWNRRLPLGSKGWLNMFNEQIWAEPFARVRHHPAFRYYSEVKYGDPEALDRKVMTKLLREISLAFQSIFSQKLLHNYQEANYAGMWLLGVLLQDRVLIDFAGPCQELSMYNHTYQDGLNGEGALNYMAMPGGYYYPYLKDPKGWLEHYPKFLEDNPFYWAASSEMYKPYTVRGLALEFGDQHQSNFRADQFHSDPAYVAEREKTGSRNWAGFGVGLLRVGGPGHRQEIGLGYTRAALHNAIDSLSLECWFDGVPVIRKGGYSCYWWSVHLQWDRPEFQFLKTAFAPHEIIEAGQWAWDLTHSPLNQNNLTVDETGTGAGWGDNRGYGEVETFKGGEAAGTPGSGFQVLDVRDHYSWSRVNKDVPNFRRTLLAVEGPDGRPYALDLLEATGGQRHQLYTSAWGERAEDHLPAVQDHAEDLARVLFTAPPEGKSALYGPAQKVTQVELLAPAAPTWDLTWKTDMAAYAARDPQGGPFKRPLPDDVGLVRMRLLGLTPPDGQTQLLRGKSPWSAILNQPLPNGQSLSGYAGFTNARDYLIENRRSEDPQKPLDSFFVHVLEGFREGEASAIKSIAPLTVTSLSGPARRLLALKLEMAGGHTDTVLYQSEPGAVKLPDGTETDARYALLRTAPGGELLGVEASRGTYLRSGAFSADLPGDFTGTIVDLDGDLTGSRQQCALILKPDKPWPLGENLKGKQILIKVESPLRAACNEGYRVEKVSALPGGLIRVDLQDYAPFVVSWHEVKVLPEDRPNTLRTNRPMVDHGNCPWYRGLQVWFPEKNKTYTIQETNEVGGGFGGDLLTLPEGTNLRADGIEVGDWYVIYALRPGLRVGVANDFTWRREPGEFEQYSVRGSGAVTLKSPLLAKNTFVRLPGGQWTECANGTAHFDHAQAGTGYFTVLAHKPASLDLRDTQPPVVREITLDGKALTVEAAQDLGDLAPPAAATVVIADGESPLDLKSLSVLLDGRELSGTETVTVTPDAKGMQVTVHVDLAAALAEEASSRRHTLVVTVRDRSLDRHVGTATLSFISVIPLDPTALYLSDVQAVSSFTHGALQLNKDYLGNPAAIAGRRYPRSVLTCPEPSATGTHGEAVYELPGGHGPLTFLAEVGIADSTTGGSVVFMVQTGPSAQGPWETLWTSPVMRGKQEPVALKVDLGEARFLRLYVTDADDGIGADHAMWGLARLKTQ